MTRPVTIGQASDIAEMVTLQPQWQLDYQQLSAGRYRGLIVNASLPGLHLTHEASNRASRQQGSLFEHHIGLALMDSSRGVCRFHGQLAGRDTVMVGLGGELDLLTPDDCSLVASLAPRASFLDVLWQMYPRTAERILKMPQALALTPRHAGQLRQLMLNVLSALLQGQGTNTHASALRHMQDAVTLAWHEALAPCGEPDARQTPPPAGNRRLIVERACRYVRDSLPHPPTMLALCREMAASPRKLEYCFQDVLGIPPARYLRLMRLNGAHRELMRMAGNGKSTVQEVASRWGFWHMGAFGSEYRRLFGRLPSQTLKTGHPLNDGALPI